jgi:hypothetical protein
MFKKLHLVVAVLLLIGTSVSAGNEKGGALNYRLPAGVTANDYIQNTIVFRVKDQYRAQCSNESVNVKELNQVLASLQSPVLYKMFPRHRKPAETFNAQGNRLVDLSLIYVLNFSGNPDLVKTINYLLSSNVLESIDPVQCAADFYILFGISNRHIVEFPIIKLVPPEDVVKSAITLGVSLEELRERNVRYFQEYQEMLRRDVPFPGSLPDH